MTEEILCFFCNLTLPQAFHRWSVTHLVRLQGLALHVEVPDFGSQVVSGKQVAAAVAELDVRHRRDDLREEGAGAGVLGLLEHCRGWDRIRERVSDSRVS